jgi:hypothetical protein
MIKLPKSFTGEFGTALATSLSNELSAIVVDIDSELSSKDEIFAKVLSIDIDSFQCFNKLVHIGSTNLPNECKSSPST